MLGVGTHNKRVWEMLFLLTCDKFQMHRALLFPIISKTFSQKRAVLLTKSFFTLRTWFIHPMVKQIYKSNSNQYHVYYIAPFLISLDGSEALIAQLVLIKRKSLPKAIYIYTHKCIYANIFGYL